MKLSFQEFVKALSAPLYVYADNELVDLEDLLSYIKNEASFLKRRRKDAE